MALHGVYSRMQDGARGKPFRNQARIVVSEACVTYSARSVTGETKSTELPIHWHGDTEFSVDWSRCLCSAKSCAGFAHELGEDLCGLRP